MLINVQRVSFSSVEVNGSIVAQIKKGLVCLICAVPNDTVNTCERVVEKLSKLRIFNDLNGKMNKSLIDINGSVLMVSQFTLAANTNSGNQPRLTDSPLRWLMEFRTTMMTTGGSM